MTTTFTKTLRIKVKPNSRAWLDRAAVEVNQVWNWANETSAKAARPFVGQAKRLTAFDLNNLSAGATKEFEFIGADTVQRVNAEFATHRRQFKRTKLRFRKSRGSVRSVSRQHQRRRAGWPGRPRNVRDYAVWLLGRREYSERELRRRLKQRQCEPHEIDDAVQFVQSYGYQSDSRYAAMKARAEARRRGNRQIQFKLTQNGIAQETIDEQLASLEPEADRAIQAVARFEGKVLDQQLKAKVWRFLASRGFSTDAIRAAVDNLKRQAADAA